MFIKIQDIEEFNWLLSTYNVNTWANLLIGIAAIFASKSMAFDCKSSTSFTRSSIVCCCAAFWMVLTAPNPIDTAGAASDKNP